MSTLDPAIIEVIIPASESTAEAAASAAAALASQSAAAASAATAATKAAEAAASAASIAGGPVASVNGRTGIVVLDPAGIPSIAPTLDLDLASINGAPFAGNLTRATAGGYRQNSKGVLVPTAINEPVIDFSAGTALGTGFYGAYTNLIFPSEDFSDAGWVKDDLTVSTNTAVAPDGATTMDSIIENTANSDRSISKAITKAASSITYTIAVFCRAGLGRAFRLLMAGAGYTGSAGVFFAPETGVLGTPALFGTGFSAVSAGSIQIGSGYLVWLTATSDATTSLIYRLDLYNGSSLTYTGNGTSGVYAWGAQLTATAFPVPYVPTTSAAVVRNADVTSITGTDFTDFFNSTGGTLFVEAYIPRGGTFPRVLQLDDGTDVNRHVLFYNSSNSLLAWQSIVSSSAQCSLASSAMSPGALFRAAYSYAANIFNASFNGSVVTPDTSGSLPAPTRLMIGMNGEPNEHIRRVIYWPKALTATELQRMTA